MIIHHIEQRNNNLLATDTQNGGTQISIWDDGSLGDMYLDLPETIALQASLADEVTRNVALLDGEHLTARIDAVQAQLDALNREVSRRILATADDQEHRGDAL